MTFIKVDPNEHPLTSTADEDLYKHSPKRLANEIVRLRIANDKATTKIYEQGRQLGRQGGAIGNCIRWIDACQYVIRVPSDHHTRLHRRILRDMITKSLDALIGARKTAQ
jgi:hypothetical protein